MLVFGLPELDCLPIDELASRAERFFSTKIGLRDPVSHREGGGSSAVVVVREERRGAPPSSAFVRATVRAVSETDLAELAKNEAARENGLYGLARRCRTVVALEGDDRARLLFAAIVASVLLGPIWLASGEVFGVKTARERLEARP